MGLPLRFVSGTMLSEPIQPARPDPQSNHTTYESLRHIQRRSRYEQHHIYITAWASKLDLFEFDPWHLDSALTYYSRMSYPRDLTLRRFPNCAEKTSFRPPFWATGPTGLNSWRHLSFQYTGKYSRLTSSTMGLNSMRMLIFSGASVIVFLCLRGVLIPTGHL